MSHPSICLAAGPATQTPVSRVSPEPCLLHPLRVVSVWAGAGGRAWLHLGGRLGPGVGTGPQPQGTHQAGSGLDQRGKLSPQAEQGPYSVPAWVGVARKAGAYRAWGTEAPRQRPQKGRPPWRRPAPQLLTLSPAPQDHVRARPSAQAHNSLPSCLGQLVASLAVYTRTKSFPNGPRLARGTRSQVGRGPPRASAALGPVDSLQPRGKFGPEPTEAVLQGGTGFAPPPHPAQEEGQAPRTQPGLGTEQSEFKVEATRVPQEGPLRPVCSSPRERLGTGMVDG